MCNLLKDHSAATEERLQKCKSHLLHHTMLNVDVFDNLNLTNLKKILNILGAFFFLGETERTELKYLEKQHVKQFEVYLVTKY